MSTEKVTTNIAVTVTLDITDDGMEIVKQYTSKRIRINRLYVKFCIDGAEQRTRLAWVGTRITKTGDGMAERSGDFGESRLDLFADYIAAARETVAAELEQLASIASSLRLSVSS